MYLIIYGNLVRKENIVRNELYYDKITIQLCNGTDIKQDIVYCTYNTNSSLKTGDSLETVLVVCLVPLSLFETNSI